MSLASPARSQITTLGHSTPHSQRFFTLYHRYITTTSPPAFPSFLRCHHCAPPIPPSHCPRRQQSTQPSPQPQNYYTLFPRTLPHGPPPGSPFPIPLRALHAEYLRLQALSHPDRHPSDKARAQGTSSYINTAYKTLSDPLLRAQYLLSVRGINMAEDEAAKTDDMELLREIMEAREEIEDARTEEEVAGLKGRNEQRIEGVVREIGEAVEKGSWGEVVAGTRELKYWYGIREALKEWEGNG